MTRFTSASAAVKKLASLWRWLRRLSGDDAYERYLRHHAELHPQESPLSRKDFFRRELERRWGGINRCC